MNPLPTPGPQHAKALIDAGFHVAPLSRPISGDSKSGKNPRVVGDGWWDRAQHAGSFDPSSFVDRNIGIATGKPLGENAGYLFVFDPDVKEGDGVAELTAWANERGGLPETFTVKTGSGGKHLYFRTRKPAGGSSFGLKYVDVRATGGQVVAPGCHHFSGRLYVVEKHLAIAWAPLWLEELIDAFVPTHKTGRDLSEFPVIDLTREMLRARALVLGPDHGSYDRFIATSRGLPVASPGNRHTPIDCQLVTELVNEFGPGITPSSLAELVKPNYPEGLSRKNFDSLIDGLESARGKYRTPEERKAEFEARQVPVSPSPASAPTPEIIETTFDLTRGQIIAAIEEIGRKTANGMGEERQILTALQCGSVDVLLPDQLERACEVLLKRFPGVSESSASSYLAPCFPAKDVAAAFAKARSKALVSTRLAKSRADLYVQAGIQLGDNNFPVPTPANVVIICRAFLGPHLRLNVRGQLLEARALPWDRHTPWRGWRDSDDVHCIEWFGNEHQLPVSIDRIRPAVMAAAESLPVDPFVEWLDSLPPWDGVTRLNHWLELAAGAASSTYVRAVSRRFLISVIARARIPGCKVDTKLVLVGPQGAGKSTLLRALVGDRFFDSSVRSPHESNKDYLMVLHRCVLHEDAEMSNYSAADVNHDKAMLSNAVDTFRPPYGRSAETYPRRFVLCGSTNEEDGFLRDVTGGRRYWPVAVSRVDLAWLTINLHQLWAEAQAAFKASEPWWLLENEGVPGAENEVKAAAEVQEQHREHDAWEDALRLALSTPPTAEHVQRKLAPYAGVPWSRLTSSQAWALIAPEASNRSITRADQMRISKALRALKWVARKGGVERWYEPPA